MKIVAHLVILSLDNEMIGTHNVTNKLLTKVIRMGESTQSQLLVDILKENQPFYSTLSNGETIDNPEEWFENRKGVYKVTDIVYDNRNDGSISKSIIFLQIPTS